MTIDTILADKQNKLYMAVDKNLSSLKRRSISYSITCYSEFLATVSVSVTGRRGIATKIVALSFDTLLQQWIIYAENKKYTLVSLTEIPSIFKSIIARLSTAMTKI